MMGASEVRRPTGTEDGRNAAVMVGCVTAGAPLLAVPALVGGDAIDDTSVGFLLEMALKTPEQVERMSRVERKREEERKGKEKRLDEFAKAWREIMSFSASSAGGASRRNWEKMREKVPKASSRPSSTRAAHPWKHGRSSLRALRSWQSCPASGCCLRSSRGLGFFWSCFPILRAAWFDSRHMFMRQFSWLLDFLVFYVKVGPDPRSIHSAFLARCSHLESGHYILRAPGSGCSLVSTLPEEYTKIVFLGFDSQNNFHLLSLVRQWGTVHASVSGCCGYFLDTFPTRAWTSAPEVHFPAHGVA